MNDLYEIVFNVAREFDAQIYDIEVVTENDQKIFRIYLSAKGGVTLELCTLVSKKLSLFFEENPPFEENYTLEVSSPGIERALIKASHFKSSIGEAIKVKTLDKEKYIGTLLDANEDEIVLDVVDKNEKITIPYKSIQKARTYFEW